MSEINKYTVEYGGARKVEMFATESEIKNLIALKPYITAVYKGKQCECIYEIIG